MCDDCHAMAKFISKILLRDCYVMMQIDPIIFNIKNVLMKVIDDTNLCSYFWLYIKYRRQWIVWQNAATISSNAMIEGYKPIPLIQTRKIFFWRLWVMQNNTVNWAIYNKIFFAHIKDSLQWILSDIMAVSAQIDMYVMCGCTEKSSELFDKMSHWIKVRRAAKWNEDTAVYSKYNTCAAWWGA